MCSCQKKEFNNCHVGSSNNDYCLFHKEKDEDFGEEEAKEFYANILDRFIAQDGRVVSLDNGPVDVSGFEFPDPPVEFHDIFKDVKFESPFLARETKFLGSISFFKTTFSKSVKFNHVNFESHTSFERSVFKGDVVFNNETSFKGSCDFSGAYFELQPKFTGCIFKNDVTFDRADFRKGAEFYGAEFKDKLRLRSIIFDGEMLFFNPEAKQERIFVKYSDVRGLIEACRIQKLSYEQEGKPIEADNLYKKEMRERRKKKGYWTSILETLLIDYTTAYGTSWGRVIGSSLLTISMFSLFYSLSMYLSPEFGEISVSSSQKIPHYLESIYFSIITFSTLGYGDLHPTGYLSIVAGFESLVGAYFISLLVVVLSRKWMRK